MAPKSHSLAVLIPHDTGQRFSCQSCGKCCRDLVVELSERDRKSIDGFQWRQPLDGEPYIKLAGKWVLNKDRQGRCVFLSDQGRCRIHEQHGFDAKPLACRLFPFTLAPAKHAVRVGWRFDCPTVARSQGKPIDNEQVALGHLARELRGGRGTASPGEVHLARGLTAQPREIDHLVNVLIRSLQDPDRSAADRLPAVVWLTTTLQEAKLEAVRGERFEELVDLLAAALPAETEANAPSAPTVRQLRMLRQLAFAYTGHVTFQEMKLGRWANWQNRWRQLSDSRRFRKGSGLVPSVAQAKGADIGFHDVDRLQADLHQADAMNECLTRYAVGKLSSRSFYGPAYYGWSVLDGLGSLWLSLAVVGWWTRYFAARRGAVGFGLEDLVTALGVVDAAAGRIPVLGSRAELLRLGYLEVAQGIGSLVARYAIWRVG